LQDTDSIYENDNEMQIDIKWRWATQMNLNGKEWSTRVLANWISRKKKKENQQTIFDALGNFFLSLSLYYLFAIAKAQKITNFYSSESLAICPDSAFFFLYISSISLSNGLRTSETRSMLVEAKEIFLFFFQWLQVAMVFVQKPHK
jgi:hypothetical protein